MKVLVVRLSSFGDIVMSLPAVHLLKQGLDCEIHWVAHREYIELIKTFRDVSHVIGFPRYSFLSEFHKFVKELRQYEYEFVIDLHGLFKSGLVTALARGKRKIGPSFYRECSGMFYSETAKPYGKNKKRHTVECMLDTIRHLGLEVSNIEFPLSLPEIHLFESEPRIAIAPASRWHSKTWPSRYFSELLRLLHQNGVTSLYLTGSKSEYNLCEEIIATAGVKCINMAGKTSFAETGALLKQMNLLIANDSGIAHFASAVGTPCIVLFGPTAPEKTAPYQFAHVIKASLPCQPCGKRRCKLSQEPCCMREISPVYVCQVAMNILNARPHE